MEDIKVSIVIPIYNAEEYLPECMESILSQTYKNIEVICVDDGSVDSSAEIIKAFQKEDERICLMQQENQYAGVARNNGFDMAKGEYTMFLDADDYFENTLVEKMLAAAQDATADIVICKSKGFDEERKKEHELPGVLDMTLLPDSKVFSAKDIPDRIFQLTAGWAWDKMYRSGFIRGKNLRFQDIRTANDELFVDLSLGEAERITTVEEALVTHRTNVESSIEYRKDRFWHCSYEMLAAERKALEQRGLFRLFEKSFLNRAAGYIAWYATTIMDACFFSEFYSFYKETGLDELGLLGYPEGCYDDPFVYETITKIKHCSEMEFLCGRIWNLNRMVKDRDFYIQELLSDLGNRMAQMNWLETRMEWMRNGKRWVYPKMLVPKGSKLILYGFGDVGSDWYGDMEQDEDVEVVMVVDRNYKKFKGSIVAVHPVEAIGAVEYDYILIAINEKKVADEVRDSLIERGMLPEKILWLDPAERGAYRRESGIW